jgi:predicted acylesterase/phospholipase RssA
VRTRLFSSFPSRADLIAAVLASCHLPSLSDGSFTVNFKGRLHIDGGLLSVVTPPPDAAHPVLVCRCVNHSNKPDQQRFQPDH